MLACVIVIGVVSGFTGAKVESSQERSDPYFTIGCTLKDPKECPVDTFIKVVSHDGDRYHLAPLADKPDFWMKQCEASPKWPFDPGDVIISFTYAENYAKQCQYLGPHWGWYAQRDEHGKTNSEQENTP